MSEGRNLIDELNRCMPAAKHSGLGDLLEAIINKVNAIALSGSVPTLAEHNALRADHNSLAAAVSALGAKLDADAANTALNDTDYQATFDAGGLGAVAAATGVALVDTVADITPLSQR